MRQSRFPEFVVHTINWEAGGDLANGGLTRDPHDAGGTTKWGISQRANKNVNVARLTIGQAKRIYKDKYWFDWMELHDPVIMFKVFDAGVLFGPSQAHRALQRALNGLGIGNIRVDGKVGSETLKMLSKAYCVEQPGTLLNLYKKELKKRIKWIITKRPTQIRFRKGWLRRIEHLPIKVKFINPLSPQQVKDLIAFQTINGLKLSPKEVSRALCYPLT